VSLATIHGSLIVKLWGTNNTWQHHSWNVQYT